jgi:hypothetical protein
VEGARRPNPRVPLGHVKRPTAVLVVRGPARRAQPERTGFEALCSFCPRPLLDGFSDVLASELEA